jgi:hypothetical protein
MTIAEQRYMERVPYELKRIADALEKLNTLIEKRVEKPETGKENK